MIPTNLQEAVVTSDEKEILAGTPDATSRVTLAIYRSGNGWLAYYPAPSDSAAASVTESTWLAAVPRMKEIARDVPHFVAHTAFDPTYTDDLPAAVAAKACDWTLCAPAATCDNNTAASADTGSVVEAANAPTGDNAAAADGQDQSSEIQLEWPTPVDAATAKQPSSGVPQKLRIDVGWTLWNAEAEDADLQYQVQLTHP